jgi:hypothetical protein
MPAYYSDSSHLARNLIYYNYTILKSVNVNPLTEENIRCHDHCQNNHERASGKTIRGYANAFING